MDILEILLINNVVNANKTVEFVKMLIVVLIVIIIILIMDNRIISYWIINVFLFVLLIIITFYLNVHKILLQYK